MKEDEWKARLIAEYLCLIYVLISVLGFLGDSKMSHWHGLYSTENKHRCRDRSSGFPELCAATLSALSWSTSSSFLHLLGSV